MSGRVLRVEGRAGPEFTTPFLGDHLDTVTSAPEGFKRLRGLVLNLAVKGRLVPQDPGDEPASTLLRQIAQEQLDAGRVVTLRDSANCGPSLSIPSGWERVALGSIVLQISDGTHHTPTYRPEGVAFISVKDIDGRTVSFSDCKYISVEEHEAINARCNPERGDILLCRIGTLGRPTIVDTDRSFSLFVSVGLLKLPKRVSLAKYLHLVLSSPYLVAQYEAIKAGGSHTNKLNLGDIPSLVIPLPPFAEQSRIVAKVEELTALIDRLEEKAGRSETARGKLLDALLAALADSPDAVATANAWKQLAPHFDLLLQTSADVDRLQQTLLTLAVKGHLVPQDPKDEPAAELLKRIHAEKERLVAEGKIKRGKLPPKQHQDGLPFDIPCGWQWASLGDIVLSSEAGWSPNCENSPQGNGKWGVLKVSAVSWGRFLDDENKELPGHLEARPEYEVLPGDFLLSRANTAELVARSVVAWNPRPRLMLSDKIIRLHIAKGADKAYFNLFNNSSFARTYYVANASGTSASMKNVSREVVLSLPVPVPPAAEQSRIVAAVTSLTDLCDRLRERLSARHVLSIKLAIALTESVLV